MTTSPTSVLSPTAARCLDAYGGAALWRRSTAVEATVSTGGLLFLSKGRRGLRSVLVRAELDAPRVTIHPIDRHGNTGVFDGSGVRIEDGDGRVVVARANPRPLFPGGRRRLWWDALDVVYFAGYALWNYLAFPALLLRDDIAWREICPGTLEAVFPPGLPTHCARQRYHVDMRTGLLRQHDYTAEVIGNWAKGAHVVLAHGVSDGIPFPARRRVTPRRGDGAPRAWPTLVWIEFEEWRLC
ncbi:MAG: hypothetical protein HY874_01950 [Chloroflexi bacterium]|nr:hypothetical protein [Chloroflexota bacterium]